MIIKANYWPNTPHLREMKVYINDKLEASSFCDRQEIDKMLTILVGARQELLMDEMRGNDANMKARIRWTLEFDYPIPEGGTFEDNQLYLEESHCQENLLDYLNYQYEHGICKLCSIGKVELLELKL